MNVCESHDFRRIFASDLRRERERVPRDRDRVLAVCCLGCGKSPLALGTSLAHFGTEGDWPESHRITAYYLDEVEGPSVEFTIIEEEP